MTQQKHIMAEFVKVPIDLITDQRLEATDKILYIIAQYLAIECGGDINIWTSCNLNLGESILMHPKAVSNSLVRLEQYGYVGCTSSEKNQKSSIEIISSSNPQHDGGKKIAIKT